MPVCAAVQFNELFWDLGSVYLTFLFDGLKFIQPADRVSLLVGLGLFANRGALSEAEVAKNEEHYYYHPNDIEDIIHSASPRNRPCCLFVATVSSGPLYFRFSSKPCAILAMREPYVRPLLFVSS
jgi:hypothetical protein